MEIHANELVVTTKDKEFVIKLVPKKQIIPIVLAIGIIIEAIWLLVMV